MLEQENKHWWFLARRAIVSSVLKRIKLPANPKILDAGCGTGGNLRMLSECGGELYGFELNDKARGHAQSLKLGTIESGILPNGIPFGDTKFDLIGFFDVLEHIEDDKTALKAVVDRLASGGLLCMNVPAYQWLFTRHDRLHHHFRRYNRTQIIGMLKAAGLTVEFASYWNFLLFPIAMLVRLFDGIGYPKHHAIGAGQPSPLINAALLSIVSAESHILPHINLPFGLSILLVARKPAL